MIWLSSLVDALSDTARTLAMFVGPAVALVGVAWVFAWWVG